MPHKHDGSPFWYVSYSDPSGKRVRESSGTASFAEAKALEAAKRLETHRVKRWGEDPRYTYDQLMGGYLEETEAKPSHWRDLECAANLQPHFTGKALADLTPQDGANYKKARRAENPKKPVKDSTLAREMHLIGAAVRHARKEWGWKIENPLKGSIPIPKRGDVFWLRQEQAGELLAQARKIKRAAKHLPDFIELAISTGMRRGELLFLEWRRVDFGARLIYFDTNDQKGQRPGSIPLNDRALAVLRRRQDFRRKNCPRSLWVFSRKNGARIAAVKKSLAAAGRAAGLDKPMTPHVLRHTFGAWLVQSGVPLRTVCELMRHKDIRTTMIYAHLAPENARAGAAALDKIHWDQIGTAVGHKVA